MNVRITAGIQKSMENLTAAIDTFILKANEDLEDELKAEGYVAAALAVSMVDELEDGWTEAYKGHCKDLLKQLRGSAGVETFMASSWPGIKADEGLRNEIYGVFHDRFLELFTACIIGFLAAEDPDLLAEGIEVVTDPAKDFVDTWAGQLADQMNSSTTGQVESLLLKCLNEQKTVNETAEAIAESSIGEPGLKARRAALTEVLRAESYGQLEAMKQNPAIIEKEWQHTGRHKNRPRPNHVAMNGQRVPVDEPFTLEGADGATYYPQCPKDICLPAGESINCHCLMKSIRDPEWKNVPVEERRERREQYVKQANAESKERNEE